MTARSESVETIDALANDPGRSSAVADWALRLRSSASGWPRRWPGSCAPRGPGTTVVSPSTVTWTTWFTRTVCESRSGTATRRRSGCTRTIVTAGEPAARYWPSRDVALAHHAVERRGERGVAHGLARQFEFGAPLFEHGLPVAHLLERVLVPALGHLQRGVGRVERGLRRDAALDERRRALAGQPRLVAAAPAPIATRSTSSRDRSGRRRPAPAGPGGRAPAAAPPRPGFRAG